MAKPVQREQICACGRRFSAPVYRSVNVNNEPWLRAAILDGSFNVVECPDCHRRFYADVPFLYHDAAAGLAVWVYPLAEAPREDEIRAKIRRAGEVLSSSVGEGLRVSQRPEDVLVFGIEMLAWRLRCRN